MQTQVPWSTISNEEFDRTIPVSPPTVNRKLNPSESGSSAKPKSPVRPPVSVLLSGAGDYTGLCSMCLGIPGALPAQGFSL